MGRQVEISLIVLATIGALAGSVVYPGSPAAFWTFHASWVLFTWLASRPPYRYAVLALTAFFFLGFWLKLLLHVLAGVAFIEPTGRFDGSPERWDGALWLIAAAFIGGSLARALDVRHDRRAAPGQAPASWVPAAFVRHRLMVWAVTAVVTAGLLVWNSSAAFAMVGVNIRTRLPFRLHVPIAFWLLFGNSAWLALLLTWERAQRGRLGASWVLLAAAEGLLTSISILSRSVYLFRVFPYLLVLSVRPDIIRRPTLPRAAVGGLLLIGGLATSVGASIFTRAAIFPSPPVSDRSSISAAAGAGPGPGGIGAVTGSAPEAIHLRQHEQALRSQRQQVPRLLVGRWVGLEGVLATSSDAGRGPRLFQSLVTEHASRGVDSAYQHLSRASYPAQDGFTFLTLAGVVGILAASGSVLVVGAGMFVVIIALTLLDGLALKMTHSALVAASVGVSAANLVAQMNFPGNTAVLYGEMVAMLLVFGAVIRVLPAHTGTSTP